MISVLLLVVLAWQFYVGYSRGFIKQVYETVALVLGLVVAVTNYQTLARTFTLWVPYAQATGEVDLPYYAGVNVFEMDSVFYAGLAFVCLVFAVYGGLKFLTIFLSGLRVERLDSYLFRWLAGGLSVLVTVVCWAMVFRLLAAVPLASLQRVLSSQFLLKIIIDFPGIAHLCHYFWVVKGLF